VEITLSGDGCDGKAGGGAKVKVTGGRPPYTYSWSNGQTGPLLDVNQSGVYTLTVTDSLGCKATERVTIQQTAPLQVKLQGRAVTCYGQKNGGASAEILGGSPPYSISWDNGSVQGSISDISEAELNNLPAGIYRVTVKDSRGCAVRDTFKIGEPAQPALSISASTTKICSGEVAELDAGAGYVSYLWSSGQTNRRLNVSQAGTFTCTVKTTEGCEFKLDPITITTGTVPARPSITFDGDRLVTTQASAYQWFLNGEPLTGAKGAKYVPSQAGKYTVKVFNAAGCANTSEPYTYNPKKALEGVEVRIYPNPNRGAFSLGISNLSEDLTILILDSEGNSIWQKQILKASGNYEEWIDLKQPPRGQYLIRIKGADGEINNTIRVQ
jgi:hypothetical protein